MHGAHCQICKPGYDGMIEMVKFRRDLVCNLVGTRLTRKSPADTREVSSWKGTLWKPENNSKYLALGICTCAHACNYSIPHWIQPRIIHGELA